MRVHNATSRNIPAILSLAGCRENRYTHFVIAPLAITIYRQDKCACGNDVSLTGEVVINRFQNDIQVLTNANLTPTLALPPELYCTEDGEDQCDRCRK